MVLNINLLLMFLLVLVKSQNIQQLERVRRNSILDESECVSMKKFCINAAGNEVNNGDQYDLSTLECLHSLHPKDLMNLPQKCQQIIWERTNELVKDENIYKYLLPLCHNDVKNLKCDKDGIFRCLSNSKENIEDRNCQILVYRIESVAFRDYKFLANFLKQCEEDVSKLQCGKIDEKGMTQIRTIACLQKNIMQVTDNCKKEVFLLSEIQSNNIKLDQQLYLDCSEDYSRYCSQFSADSGLIFHCLIRQDPGKLSKSCKDSLSRREKLISQDYRISKGLMRSCRDDIKRTHCRKQTSNDRTIRLAEILLCLENFSKNGSKISSDCQAELIEHRRMLMEDYRLSPEIVDSCKKEIAFFCNGFDAGGVTIHCLMKNAKRKNDITLGNFNEKCQLALGDLIKETDAGENWKVDPILFRACSPVASIVCKDINSGNSRVMNCLMDNLGSNYMTEECEEALVQIQYFVSRQFELDPQLFRACKTDAKNLCNYNNEINIDEHGGYDTQTLPCLYRYATLAQEDVKLERNCLQNIHRVMRQRAISVDLEPAIEDSCLSDLGYFCNNKVKKGEEIQCLQDNYVNLKDKCQKTINVFTQLQAEHADVNPYINKYCRKIIDSLCTQEAKNDEGDVMECLIKNKNDPAIKAIPTCRASIEHFQLISLNDYRISYKFKVACKASAIRFCPSDARKNDIIRCLSEHVLNATINGVKSQLPRECKQQLKIQSFQQRENVAFNPALKTACSNDIKKYCPSVLPGNAQVLECLQVGNHKLSTKCEKEVFKIKKQEMYDNSIDYTLITVCADAIEQFCSQHDKSNVLECLKKNKDEKDLNRKCKLVITHRLQEQNYNYQLNPSLYHSCSLDMNKFCKSLLTTNNDKDTNGVVIKCLKEQFKLGKLTNRCEKEISSILREQALNINLNPLIRTVCANELATICHTPPLQDGKENINDEHDDNTDEGDTGDAEECLKDALLNKRIQTPACKVEIANMIEESQVDIHVDPLLQQACALDLLNFCIDVPQGNGRHINCLKTLLVSAKEKLSPKCKNMLKKRLEMYKNVAKFSDNPPEGFNQLYTEVVTSPSKQYFIIVIMMFLGSIFLIGILCGRLNQRKFMLLKSK